MPVLYRDHIRGSLPARIISNISAARLPEGSKEKGGDTREVWRDTREVWGDTREGGHQGGMGGYQGGMGDLASLVI